MKGLSIIKSLSYKGDFAPLLKLTLPLVLTGVVQSSLGFFETIFLAWLGPHVLAAGALVEWFYAILIVILFGTFSSVNILVAHKHGANDITGISHVLRDGLLLSVILLVPAFLLLWNMAPLFLLFGQSPALVELATAYLRALAWGLLPQFVLVVLYETLIGLGHTRVISIFTMLTMPIFIFMSYVLIFGKFGFPSLGIAGAGWGCTIANWISTTLLCIYIGFNKQYRCYLKSIFTFTSPSFLWE